MKIIVVSFHVLKCLPIHDTGEITTPEIRSKDFGPFQRETKFNVDMAAILEDPENPEFDM